MKRSTSLLVAVLFLGAYLRLYKISEYLTFLGDEGRDVLIVKRMIVDHTFTLLGPTASVGGFFLGPIYYYFMLPFLWLWHLDPTGPAVMVALFGIATIYLVYRIGADFFHTWVGLGAASLYALSPIIIAYSRSSWNPNVVPFFSTLLIYLLWAVAVRKRERDFFWIGVAAGIGLQLHYLFTFLIILSAVWIIFFVKPKQLIRSLCLTMAGFAVGYGPFLLFELRHGFPNTQTVIRFIFQGKETGFVFLTFIKNIIDVAFRLFGRLVLRIPQEEFRDKFTALQMWTWVSATNLLIFLSLAASGYLATRKKIVIEQKRGAQLLTLWFVVTLFLFGLYKKGIYDYYFGIIFALPFLLTGLVLWLLFRRNQLGKAVASTFLIGLLYLNWQGRPFLYPPNNQLAQAKLIAAAAIDKTDGKPFNFALLTGNNSDHAFRYFFEIWGKPPVTIENDVNDPQRKTVTGQLIVICELPKSACKPLGHPLWEVAGFGRAEIVEQWDVSFVTIYKLVHYIGEKK